MPYTDFYVASVTVAGALTGLLFVALSVAQGRGEGTGSAERQAIAATAFTALVDSLWISLVALLPGDKIPGASLVLGLLGLSSTAALTVRLWRARAAEKFTHRWPVLLPLITLLYGLQTASSFTPLGGRTPQSSGATFVLIFFAVGIARSWELLGVRGGGALDLLTGREPGTGHDEPQ